MTFWFLLHMVSSAGIQGLILNWDYPPVESLCSCVLEQDTLSAAQDWFNLGRREIVPTCLKN